MSFRETRDQPTASQTSHTGLCGLTFQSGLSNDFAFATDNSTGLHPSLAVSKGHAMCLPSLGGAPACQQVIKEGGAPGADVGVEATDGEDPQPVEGALGAAGHVHQQALYAKRRPVERGM